jgi:serine/threonine protein phosphatase PrpC
VHRDAPVLVLGRPSIAAAERGVLRDQGHSAEAGIRADGGDADWCALRAASVAGVRHRLSGQPGQDSFAWGRLPDGLVVAVADGLGGVPGSDHTAGRAVAAAVDAVVAAAGPPAGSQKRPAPARAAALQLVAGFEAANVAAAAEGGATTLMLGLIDRTGEVCLARVGDTTAFLIGGDGRSWRELFAPPEDEDTVVTATAALPAAQVELEFATLATTTDDLLLFATDGVSDPWRDGPATVAPVLAAALAERPGPLELAQLASFSRQGCHDDRTMVVVWRHGPAAAPAGSAPGD